MKRWLALIALLVLVWSCTGPERTPATHPTRSSTPDGPQARTSENTHATAASHAPYLPDPKLTPGDTLEVMVDDICTPGFSKKIRNVPASVKRQTYEEYGIHSHEPGESTRSITLSAWSLGAPTRLGTYGRRVIGGEERSRQRPAGEQAAPAGMCRRIGPEDGPTGDRLRLGECLQEVRGGVGTGENPPS
jgi:hypothetical protein